MRCWEVHGHDPTGIVNHGLEIQLLGNSFCLGGRCSFFFGFGLHPPDCSLSKAFAIWGNRTKLFKCYPFLHVPCMTSCKVLPYSWLVAAFLVVLDYSTLKKHTSHNCISRLGMLHNGSLLAAVYMKRPVGPLCNFLKAPRKVLRSGQITGSAPVTYRRRVESLSRCWQSCPTQSHSPSSNTWEQHTFPRHLKHTSQTALRHG